MNKTIRTILIFGLGALAAIVLVGAFVMFQTFNSINKYFSGMDTYTCRQFEYDLTHEDTDKMFPVMVATLAYGDKFKDEAGQLDTTALRKEFDGKGIKPAVQKVLQLCQGNPGRKVLSVFVADIVSSTLPPAAPSATTPAAASQKQGE